MGMTLTEKILARKTGQAKVSPGDLVTVGVDTASDAAAAAQSASPAVRVVGGTA